MHSANPSRRPKRRSGSMRSNRDWNKNVKRRNKSLPLGEFDGRRNEAGAAYEEGRKIPGRCQKEWRHSNDKARGSKASEQTSAAGHKRFAVAAPVAAIAFIQSKKWQMSRQKHPDRDRICGPGASYESRKQPEKSKARGEREARIQSDNASERER